MKLVVQTIKNAYSSYEVDVDISSRAKDIIENKVEPFGIDYEYHLTPHEFNEFYDEVVTKVCDSLGLKPADYYASPDLESIFCIETEDGSAIFEW